MAHVSSVHDQEARERGLGWPAMMAELMTVMASVTEVNTILSRQPITAVLL